MPTPPVPVPNGQAVLWVTATSVVPFVGNGGAGTAVANPTSGTVTQFASSPLGNTNERITWSGYQKPNALTRHDIVIHGIYAVIEFNGSVGVAVPGMTLGGINQAPGIYGTSPFNSSAHELLGTDPAIITASTTKNVISLDQTLPIGPYTPADVINATYVGLAVYIDKIPLPTAFIGQRNDTYLDIGG